jgi:hypothetical protein
MAIERLNEIDKNYTPFPQEIAEKNGWNSLSPQS